MNLIKKGPGMLFLLIASQLPAQNLIKGSNTDQKFANTTVVYRDSAVSDQAILDQLNNSDLGIGDVVRITTPPPTPKPAATISVKKNTIVQTVAPARPTILVQSANTPMVASTDDIGMILTNAPAVPLNSARKTVVRPRITPAMVEYDREETRTTVSHANAKSGKSVHASASRSSYAAKRTAARGQKRHKKQHYGCYKF